MFLNKKFIHRHRFLIYFLIIFIFGGIILLQEIILNEKFGKNGNDAENTSSSLAIETALPFKQKSFVTDTHWQNIWGNVNPAIDGLELSAEPNTQGAVAILNATSQWHDYFYSAKIKWSSGSDVALIARYQNNQNYVSCNFDQQSVSIQQDSNGTSTNLYGIGNKLTYTLPETSLEIGVQGNVVSCYEGSQVVASSTITDPKINSGGIGIEIWDKKNGNAQVVLQSVSVVPTGSMSSLLATLPKYKSNIRTTSLVSSATDISTTSVSNSNDDIVTLPYIFNPNNLILNPAGKNNIKVDNGQLGDWDTDYGNFFISEGRLFLNAVPYTTDGIVALNEAKKLSNYEFTLNFDWKLGAFVELFARDNGSGDYAICKYGDQGNSVYLLQDNNYNPGIIAFGSTKALIANPSAQNLPTITSASIKVVGNTATCYANGEPVASGTLPGLPASGTIAIHVYADAASQASIIINSVQITPEN